MNKTVIASSRVLVIAAVAAGLVAGCSGEKKAIAPVANVSAGPAMIPTQVANDVKTRRQATITGCAKGSPDGWTAEGTIQNPGKDDADYTVTVFFTTTKATVLDFASTKVSVPAGKTGEWTAHKDFKAPAKMLCVLRGVA